MNITKYILRELFHERLEGKLDTTLQLPYIHSLICKVQYN